MTSEVKQVKSITPKMILELGRGAKLAKPEKPEKLYIVFGVATGLVPKPTAFDADQFAIAGRFEAIRAKDQQRFAAEYLYLPGDKHDQVVNLMQPNKDTGLLPEFELAFEIGYAPNADSPTGYVFSCSPVLDTKVQDKLADTRRQVESMLGKLLPPPPKTGR